MSDDLKKAFRKTDPDIHKQIESVESWAREERRKVAMDIEANKQTWLDEERVQIALERQTPSLDLKPDFPETSIEQEAQERVSRKIQGLMAAVEDERSQRIEEITTLPHATHSKAPPPEGKPTQERLPAHPFKKETHKTIERVQDVRKRYSKHASKMRETFLKHREDSGAGSPAQDLNRSRGGWMKRIDTAEHRLVDKVFKKHGIDRAPRQAPDGSGPKQGE